MRGRVSRPIILCIALVASGGPATLASPPVRGAAPSVSPEPTWLSYYDGGVGRRDTSNDVGVSPDGATVFVTGNISGNGYDDDWTTIAYDSASGAEVWTARFSGRGHAYDRAVALAVAPDGSRVFVTGRAWGPGYDYNDFATVAYDAATGAQLWAVEREIASEDWPTSIAVSPDGTSVFVTGTSGQYRIATIAYDAATGAERWIVQDQGQYQISAGSDVATSPDGGVVFVTGYRYNGSSDEYRTLAYDAASGSPLWASIYNSPGFGYDLAFSLGVSPDGAKIFVTGGSEGDFRDDFVTIAYDAVTGAGLWLVRYDGTAQGDDEGLELAVAPDGALIYVTGESVGAETDTGDYVTIAYDASTGGQVWLSSYDGSGHGTDTPESMMISPDGSRLYVTGLSKGNGTAWDYATLAYDASTGIEAWEARYTGPGTRKDVATGVVVAPDGATVYVTGSSRWSDTGMDYATLAYPAFPGPRG